jgi:hypothetical protein
MGIMMSILTGIRDVQRDQERDFPTSDSSLGLSLSGELVEDEALEKV